MVNNSTNINNVNNHISAQLTEHKNKLDLQVIPAYLRRLF